MDHALNSLLGCGEGLRHDDESGGKVVLSGGKVVLSGETESGSAEEHPGEGYPDRRHLPCPMSPREFALAGRLSLA